MSIRIKTDEALTLLNATLIATEQEYKEAKEAYEKSLVEEQKFKVRLAKELSKRITADHISPYQWFSHKSMVRIEMAMPEGMEWSEQPFAYKGAASTAEIKIEEIKELIKLLSISADSTVTVTNAVFKSLSKYL